MYVTMEQERLITHYQQPYKKVIMVINLLDFLFLCDMWCDSHDKLA